VKGGRKETILQLRQLQNASFSFSSSFFSSFFSFSFFPSQYITIAAYFPLTAAAAV